MHDTVVDLLPYLTDLDSLHELRRIRHVEGYERGNRDLAQWLVLGRFMLDSCGNFGRCEQEHDYKPVEWLWSSLPLAIKPTELHATLKGVSIGWSPFMPPRSNDVCGECGHGWTIANCHDAIQLRQRSSPDDPLEFQHRGCHALMLQRRDIQWLTAIAKDAGLEKAVVQPIPDEYCPDAIKHGSWVLLRTAWGDIKIGPRKRVIEISWHDVTKRATDALKAEQRRSRAARPAFEEEDAALKALAISLDGTELFAAEDVTKDRALVHAWGKEKAVEYLTVVGAAVKALVPR
jgi:hypothetical protein